MWKYHKNKNIVNINLMEINVLYVDM
jgi:hypothetical protein